MLLSRRWQARGCWTLSWSRLCRWSLKINEINWDTISWRNLPQDWLSTENISLIIHNFTFTHHLCCGLRRRTTVVVYSRDLWHIWQSLWTQCVHHCSCHTGQRGSVNIWRKKRRSKSVWQVKTLHWYPLMQKWSYERGGLSSGNKSVPLIYVYLAPSLWSFEDGESLITIGDISW